jgi:hypothetical protein
MARVGFDGATKVFPGPVVALDHLTLDVADGELSATARSRSATAW